MPNNIIPESQDKAMNTLFSLAWMPLMACFWVASSFRTDPMSPRGVRSRQDPVQRTVTFKEKDDAVWEVE